MGGKNHQPCNRPKTNYLRYSTRMSRAASQAHMLCEQANVHLENVLLAELDGETGSVVPIIEALIASKRAISDCRHEVASLSQDMRRNDYTDLPTLHALDLEGIGTAFANEQLVNKGSWDAVVFIMKEKNFYGVLDWFDRDLDNLAEATQQLLRKAENLEQAASQGIVTAVLESNLPGNLKVEFARLYTAWDRFNCMFLASSILSTELWYAFTRHGSLLDPGSKAHVA